MKIHLSILCFLMSMNMFAQQSLPAGQNYYDGQSQGIVYNKEFSIDLKLITQRSFALGVNIGQLKNYYQTQFFNIEIGNLRHSMEVRDNPEFTISSFNRVSRSFVFGKQNSAYVLRTGWGMKRYLSEKAKRKGLAMGVSYQIGPEIAILKPYYLELVRVREQGPSNVQAFISDETFSDENANLFLDLNRVLGASSFSEGLGELGVMPGIHARAAVHFAWGAFDENVKALEAGIMMDLFFKEVPIMVEHSLVPHLKNSPLFLNLYITLQLGKRR